MFIQTEKTPDPARLKFLPGREVMPEGTLDIADAAAARRSPLASRIFAVDGVTGVSFGPDYITVTKGQGEWDHLKPTVLGAIVDHFLDGAPLLLDSPSEPAGDGAPQGDLAEVIRTALKRVIDPELGYNIVDIGLIYEVLVADGGAVTINMTTTTRGCPATDYLMNGSADAAESVDGVQSVQVALTYDPPWTPDMMSPEAKDYFHIRD